MASSMRSRKRIHPTYARALAKATAAFETVGLLSDAMPGSSW
jgi:hypothetical protein